MDLQHKLRFLRKKRYQLLLILIIGLIAFRLYLPTMVKNYVNKVLSEIPGYYGHVEDIDLALIRGAYVINGMYLNKINSQTQVPFLNFPKNDISIEWKSLFKGKIVSEVIMYSPEYIYIYEDHHRQIEGKDADVNDWTQALTDIVPIDINHYEVHDGKIAFVNLQKGEDIDLHINKIELTADNLRNVEAKERTLPSPVHATGVSVGQGKVTLTGNLNVFKEIPDMDFEFALEDAEVSAFNAFTRNYGHIDFDSGKFGMFSEIAIADGYLKGYLKMLITDSKLISKEEGLLSNIWEGFVSFFKYILKNHKTDTFAMKIPIEGDLNKVEGSTWPTIFSIFKNGWFEAFKRDVDDEIEYKDAFKDKKEKRKKKKEKDKS